MSKTRDILPCITFQTSTIAENLYEQSIHLEGGVFDVIIFRIFYALNEKKDNHLEEKIW